MGTTIMAKVKASSLTMTSLEQWVFVSKGGVAWRGNGYLGRMGGL